MDTHIIQTGEETHSSRPRIIAISGASNCGEAIFTVWRDFVCLQVFFVTLRQSNMTMENPPFEDVFPIKNGDFPVSC